MMVFRSLMEQGCNCFLPLLSLFFVHVQANPFLICKRSNQRCAVSCYCPGKPQFVTTETSHSRPYVNTPIALSGIRALTLPLISLELVKGLFRISLPFHVFVTRTAITEVY